MNLVAEGLRLMGFKPHFILGALTDFIERNPPGDWPEMWRVVFAGGGRFNVKLPGGVVLNGDGIGMSGFFAKFVAALDETATEDPRPPREVLSFLIGFYRANGDVTNGAALDATRQAFPGKEVDREFGRFYELARMTARLPQHHARGRPRKTPDTI